MSAPYREVSSRLKRLLSEGGVIEGSLYRADRGNTPRHQLSDRATGRFRSIYVPADFAPVVADWSARWAEAKRLLKEMSEVARAARRSRAAGVICNLCPRGRRVDGNNHYLIQYATIEEGGK